MAEEARREARVVAALYVLPDGAYAAQEGVEAWDEARDARTYAGPHPVVAHPPCARWGRYWYGGPSVKVRRIRGDDDGCFAAALAAVRRWSGVLEHPAYSSAWAAFGLIAPPFDGGWVVADWQGGWTCHVEQGHYGHRARKATWLYACRVRDLPSLRWGPSAARVRIDAGFHSAEERRRFMRPPPGMPSHERYALRRPFLARHAAATGKVRLCPEFMSKREREATPPAFRDLLLRIARGVQP